MWIDCTTKTAVLWTLVCREFSKGRKTIQRQPEIKSSQLSLGEDASVSKLIKVLREWNIPMQLIMDHWYQMLVAACSLLWSQSLYNFKLTFSNKWALLSCILFFFCWFSLNIQRKKLKPYKFTVIPCIKNLSRYQLGTIKVIKVIYE